MRIHPVLAALAMASAFPVTAAEFTSLNTLAQGEFRRVSEDLGAAISYKGVTPATPLGLAGFDVGVEVSTTKLENSALFRRAGAGSPADLVVPKVHVHKGLWGGVDIGAFVAGSSQIDAALYGAELRYALVDDGIATPAVGLRLSGSRATGTGDLRLGTLSADVVVSKLGYGIVSECIASRVPLLYTLRGRFVEQDVFVQEMPEVLRCRHIDAQDLREGDWADAVHALLAQPEPPRVMPTNGAEVVADRILSLVNGG